MNHPTAQQVSDFLKRKFTSVARFADIAKLDAQAVRNTLKLVAGPKLSELLQTAQDVLKDRPNAVASWEISDAEREAVKTHVADQFGGNLSAFARQHGLDFQTADQVIRGRRKRKTSPVLCILAAARPLTH